MQQLAMRKIKYLRRRRAKDGQDGDHEESNIEFKKKVTGKGSECAELGLEEIHKQMEVAAKSVNFSTKAMRHNAEKKVPDEVNPGRSCSHERESDREECPSNASQTGRGQTCSEM